MRYLLLALSVGCTTVELDVEGELGEVVSLIEACPRGQWCVEPTPLTTGPKLHSVWAVSANDVFVVGEGGTILRRIDNQWTVMSSGTSHDLLGVWAASSTDVWAVGTFGTILRFNGSTWSDMSVGGSAPIDAVWGSSATDVWLAGGSRVLQWNGTTLTSHSRSGTLLSVSGTGPLDVWVTGENTFLHHYTGSWEMVNPSAGSMLLSVTAAGTNELWITGLMMGREVVRYFPATTKSSVKSTGGVVFQNLAVVASNDVWGVSNSGGRVGHWNGMSWSISQPFGSVALWSIVAVTGHAWLVGNSGLIAHRAL